MTKCIIHIGETKTGSTSIQDGLVEAREALRGQGIAYCAGTGSRNHNDLTGLLGTRVHMDFTNEKVVQRARDKVEAIRQAHGESDYILLSSEPYFELGPDFVARVLDLLDLEFEAVFVIGYVRHPVDGYLSWAKQLLMTRSDYIAPDRHRSQAPRRIQAWKAAYGPQALDLAPYARAQFKDGDVVQDFAGKLAAITGRPVSLPAGIASKSDMSAEHLAAIQMLRREVLADHEKQKRPEVSALLFLGAELRELGLRGTKPRLSAAARSALEIANAGKLKQMQAQHPEFGFVAPETPPEPPETAPWRENPSVLSILEDYDEAVLELLRRIALAPYAGAGAGEAGFVAERLPAAMERPDHIDGAVAAISAYWRECGAGALADELEKAAITA